MHIILTLCIKRRFIKMNGAYIAGFCRHPVIVLPFKPDCSYPLLSADWIRRETKITLSSKNYVQAGTYITIPEKKPNGPDGKPTDLISPIIPSSIFNTKPFALLSIPVSPTTNTPISKLADSTAPSSTSSILNTPNSTHSILNTGSSTYSIPYTPSSRPNITNSLITSSNQLLAKSNQSRKSIKPLFGLVPTKDFFKILETPMIYRPPPVYNIGLQPTPTPPPFLNPRRASSSILCQDFVTPILTAAIRNLTYPYIVTSKDHFITRILRLLHTDVTIATEDDVKTMVWQVSNIDIRLYQWSALAMTKLLNTITLHNEEDHWTLSPKLRSLRNLKHELEAILISWRLDLSDKEPILRDSKIIRPPCCCGNTLGQSTLAPTITMFTTKETKSPRDIGRMGPEVVAGPEEELIEYEDDSLEMLNNTEATPTIK